MKGTGDRMTIQEFLKELAQALEGEVNTSTITSQLQYYEDYMNRQKQDGKSEYEITGDLGDPRLIARTIIITSEQNAKQRNHSNDRKFQTAGDDIYKEDISMGRKKSYFSRTSGLVSVLILIFILFILIKVTGFAIKLLFNFGVPILIFYLGYTFIRNIFGKKGRH